MIPDFGERAGFIWTAYGLVALVVAGLIAWLRLEGRRHERRLAQLEAAREPGQPGTGSGDNRP